jgi:hypothetical protein
LRSKSDAQIAEAVIKSKLHEVTGILPSKPELRARAFKFRFPNFLKDAGPVVGGLIELVREADFVVEPTGKVKMPKQLADAKINIGTSTYKMGIGGLHSTEKSACHVAAEDTLIVDRDVASFYPAIIIQTGLYPRHLGKSFLDVYRGIRDTRIIAKRTGDKTVNETLKIVLNGSFGKFGNPWSILYSPDLLIQVTVTGQLALLMLIEAIESCGIAVVSANTDGIVIKCPIDKRGWLDSAISAWERRTGFETEETRYKLLASRDVNSYIAVKENGGVKLKGAYAEPEPVASSWPSPHNQVCVMAACDYLEYGVPVELSIAACSDVKQFIEVRNVTGGGTWRGQYLGRAVRWYKSTDGEPIFYKKANKSGNHNKVADTDGCRPLMEMDDSMPTDLDTQWYIDEAYRILRDIGALQGKP